MIRDLRTAMMNARATKRALYAYELRLAGMKLREIGTFLGGVSRERARQVVAKGERTHAAMVNRINGGLFNNPIHGTVTWTPDMQYLERIPE